MPPCGHTLNIIKGQIFKNFSADPAAYQAPQISQHTKVPCKYGGIDVAAYVYDAGNTWRGFHCLNLLVTPKIHVIRIPAVVNTRAPVVNRPAIQYQRILRCILC